MGALPQALEIIFKLQMKRNNEKITRRKISFPTHKMCFYFSFWTPPTFKASIFFISCPF
jgi:hypothetical protein